MLRIPSKVASGFREGPGCRGRSPAGRHVGMLSTFTASADGLTAGKSEFAHACTVGEEIEVPTTKLASPGGHPAFQGANVVVGTRTFSLLADVSPPVSTANAAEFGLQHQIDKTTTDKALVADCTIAAQPAVTVPPWPPPPASSAPGPTEKARVVADRLRSRHRRT